MPWAARGVEPVCPGCVPDCCFQLIFPFHSLPCGAVFGPRGSAALVCADWGPWYPMRHRRHPRLHDQVTDWGPQEALLRGTLLWQALGACGHVETRSQLANGGAHLCLRGEASESLVQGASAEWAPGGLPGAGSRAMWGGEPHVGRPPGRKQRHGTPNPVQLGHFLFSGFT